MVLWLLSCGPTVVPYPPPASFGVEEQALDPGQVELSGAVTAGLPLLPIADAPALSMLDWGFLSGPGQARVGVGLPNGWAARGGLTRVYQGYLGSGELSRRVLDEDAVVVMATLGGGFKRVDSSVAEPLDSGHYGDPVGYGYRSYSPAVGGTLDWRLATWVSVTSRLRFSYAFAIPDYGPIQPKRALWVQSGSSVVFHTPTLPIHASLGLNVQASRYTGYRPWTTPTFGIGVRFPAPD